MFIDDLDIFVIKEPSIYTNTIIIESPNGKKIYINPVNAYLPDYENWKMLAKAKRLERWDRQFTDEVPNLGEEAIKIYVDCLGDTKSFLKIIKLKGYKVYWQK